MQLKRFIHLSVFLTVSALTVAITMGCVPRKVMVDAFVGMVQDGLPAVEQEQDLQLLAQSIPAHIKLLETLLASDPENRDLLVLLARLYGGYAFAVLETEFEARHWGKFSVLDVGLPDDKLETTMARYFQRGAQYALRALEVNYPQAQQQLQKPISADQFFKSLTPKDAPALFWYGFNLGGHIQHRLDSILAMSKAHLVERAMQRVLTLNENYYHGNAHLVLLAYYASRSPMTGGNPALAEAHFERHTQLRPNDRGLRQLYLARYLLVQHQEKEQYRHQLKQVAKAITTQQDGGLLASVAATRAQVYLEATDQFFD